MRDTGVLRLDHVKSIPVVISKQQQEHATAQGILDHKTSETVWP